MNYLWILLLIPAAVGFFWVRTWAKVRELDALDRKQRNIHPPMNKIGRTVLMVATVIVAVAIVALTWLDIMEPCKLGDLGISIGHMVAKGCR